MNTLIATAELDSHDTFIPKHSATTTVTTATVTASGPPPKPTEFAPEKIPAWLALELAGNRFSPLNDW